MTPADVSVVIPTFNEAAAISDCIESARKAGAKQIIIADGGSSDGTVEIARRAGSTTVVEVDLGRGVQLNGGAARASGEVILFLHADNCLSQGCLEQICRLPTMKWGAFRQRIDSQQPIFRIIERGNALRVSMRGVAFGDQAIFVRHDLFDAQDGFRAVPLMEDVELSQRLRRIAKPTLLDGPVHISARRWKQHGVIRQTARNWSIQVAYRLGASPESLVKFYRRNDS